MTNDKPVFLRKAAIMEKVYPNIVDTVEILTHMDENDFGNKTSDVTLM